jgi:hypothetical protein
VLFSFRGQGRGAYQGPGKGTFHELGRVAYQWLVQAEMLTKCQIRGAYQGLVQGKEGGEERPVHQVGEENEGVRLLQIQDEYCRNEGHALRCKETSSTSSSQN